LNYRPQKCKAIDLQSIRVKSVDSPPNAFRVDSRNQSFVAYVNTQEEKEAWMDDFAKLVPKGGTYMPY
jgi:hypothetical protein